MKDTVGEPIRDPSASQTTRMLKAAWAKNRGGDQDKDAGVNPGAHLRSLSEAGEVRLCTLFEPY